MAEIEINTNIEDLVDMADLLEELHYLRHFYAEADFGPAHGDVVDIINNNYEGDIPEGYKL